MKQSRSGIVVPHTHWDRAWYLPFQAYRLRLVEMMTDLLGWLESGALPLFVLDGQTVLLEDYFAVRPQDKPRVQALVEAGKIKVGPWYTMPDCFLARPESLIRNLQRGLQMGDELGGASRVGYVPDSFGHFAQLPQILLGLGIDSFLFMRGMPEQLRDDHGAVFLWQSPDGSQVLSTFLREGYFPLGALGQESFHGRYDGLSARAALAQERLSGTLARLLPVHKENVLVLPAGGDHLPARDDLVAVASQLNQAQSEINLRFGSFEDYLHDLRASLGSQKMPVHCGDLLGQADHPLLRNVLSSRVDLKILNHRAQDLLTGVVEPLLAWSSLNGLPCADAALLQIAWDALLKNHAHDDICGCSVDDVHLDDVQRFHEVLALSQEIITRQVEHIIQRRLSAPNDARTARVFVFNPHPWPVAVSAQVRILLADDGGEFSEKSASRALQAVDSEGHPLALRVLSTECKAIRNRYLETTWGRAYELCADVSLPALGFEIITIEETSANLRLAENMSGAAVPQELTSGFRFELDADLGDGYSHGPCPELPMQRARLLSAESDSRLDGVYHLTFEITGPAYIRRDDLSSRPLNDCLGPSVGTTICVRACRRPVVDTAAALKNQGVAVTDNGCTWDLQISYTNVFKDSRLRIVFDPRAIAATKELGAYTDVLSHGQGQWIELPATPAAQELWEGPLAKPAYPGEKEYPVHHTNDGVVLVAAQGNVFAGGVGLHEFELVGSQTNSQPCVAYTLHRAVGDLSVRGGRIRSCQAGPQRPTPDAQLQRQLDHHVTFGFAATTAAAMRRLREGVHPCWVQECPVVPVIDSSETNSIRASVLNIGNTALEMMSLRPAGRGVVLRLCNPTGSQVQSDLLLPVFAGAKFKAQRIQLDERTPVSAAAVAQETLSVNFKPFEIQTWKIEPC
ncbi:MAG: hypothetical protein RLZZ488_673 [Pseudomonadota bacterium]|jgi:mannosylglycerate hydrolase